MRDAVHATLDKMIGTGTHFTCFTSTNLQILTAQELQASAWPCRMSSTTSLRRLGPKATQRLRFRCATCLCAFVCAKYTTHTYTLYAYIYICIMYMCVYIHPGKGTRTSHAYMHACIMHMSVYIHSGMSLQVHEGSYVCIYVLTYA